MFLHVNPGNSKPYPCTILAAVQVRLILNLITLFFGTFLLSPEIETTMHQLSGFISCV